MRQFKFFQVRNAVTAVAHKLCSLFLLDPVTVEFCGSVSTACINNRGDITLADMADSATVTNVVMIRYVGFVVHELLHRKYTDFSINAKTQYLRELHNAVEDIWIERQAIAAGLTGNITSVMTDLIDQMVDHALGEVTDWSDPRQYPFALAVWGRRYATKKVPVASGLESVFDEASKRIDAAKSSAATLAIAQWVYDQMVKLPEQPPQPPQKTREGDEEGEGKDTTPGGGEEGEGEGEDEGAPAGPAKNPVQGGKVVEAKSVSGKLSTDGGTGGSYSKDSGLGYDGAHLFSGDGSMDIGRANPRMAFDIKKMFECTGIDEWSTGRKSGSINVGSLASIRTGNVNVFKQRREEDGVDSAVVVCVDVSGSMGGNKIRAAVDMTTALLNALGLAGTSTAILTFGSRTSLVKGFDDNYKRGIRLANRMGALGCGTNDYFCLRYAHELLAYRQEARKVVFFVTDGQGWYEPMKAQVAVGDAMGITSVGVGIGQKVSNVFGVNRSVFVRSSTELMDASFAKIKLVA